MRRHVIFCFLSVTDQSHSLTFINLLRGKCLIVHEKEINIAGVMDEEGFVTRGH